MALSTDIHVDWEAARVVDNRQSGDVVDCLVRVIGSAPARDKVGGPIRDGGSQARTFTLDFFLRCGYGSCWSEEEAPQSGEKRDQVDEIHFAGGVHKKF